MNKDDKRLKILFFHFDLGVGGAERVLANLVNSIDKSKFDITVQTIFGKGPNRQLLDKDIKFKCLFNRKAFRGMRQVFKIFSPVFLHNILIREKYDVEIAYLEQIPTRIISGCTDKATHKYAWVHCTAKSQECLSSAFRNMDEFYKSYANFDKIAFVSNDAKKSFYKIYEVKTDGEVVHNVLQTDVIKAKSEESIEFELNKGINICGVGRLTKTKGFDRAIRSLKRISDSGINNWHFYILGTGDEENNLRNLAIQSGLSDKITFLGFRDNPYKYVSKMDLLLCSSFTEGYSTVATESLLLGIPVLTTDCAGMEEIIGNTDAGIIVSNNEEELYAGLSKVMSDKRLLQHMRNEAIIRGQFFSKEASIKEFERFISFNHDR